MVLLDDSLVGFERNTPHFEQLFAPQLIRNMAACEAWSVFPIYFRFVFHFLFFFCLVSFLFAWFLFCLHGFIFSCVVSFLFAVFSFLFACFLFCLRVFFFVCVVSFLFAACPL